MKVYISSYAPSLLALLRTRDRLRSQRKACAASASTPKAISFAAVGQVHPSEDTGLSQFEGVTRNREDL